MNRKNIIPEFTKDKMDQLLYQCNLTPREQELVCLRQQEYTLEECAEQMEYSVSTINRLQKKIYIKLRQLN